MPRLWKLIRPNYLGILPPFEDAFAYDAEQPGQPLVEDQLTEP
jgi:hypothetical protein